MDVDLNKLFELDKPFRTDANLDELFPMLTHTKEFDFDGDNLTVVLDNYGTVNDFSLFVSEDKNGNLFIKQYDNHCLPVDGMTPVRYVSASKEMIIALAKSFQERPTKLSLADSDRGM